MPNYRNRRPLSTSFSDDTLAALDSAPEVQEATDRLRAEAAIRKQRVAQSHDEDWIPLITQDAPQRIAARDAQRSSIVPGTAPSPLDFTVGTVAKQRAAEALRRATPEQRAYLAGAGAAQANLSNPDYDPSAIREANRANSAKSLYDIAAGASQATLDRAQQLSEANPNADEDSSFDPLAMLQGAIASATNYIRGNGPTVSDTSTQDINIARAFQQGRHDYAMGQVSPGIQRLLAQGTEMVVNPVNLAGPAGMAAQMSGAAYADARNAGVSKEGASDYARTMGGVGGALGLIPFGIGRVANPIARRTLGPLAERALARTFAPELASTGSQIVSNIAGTTAGSAAFGAAAEGATQAANSYVANNAAEKQLAQFAADQLPETTVDAWKRVRDMAATAAIAGHVMTPIESMKLYQKAGEAAGNISLHVENARALAAVNRQNAAIDLAQNVTQLRDAALHPEMFEQAPEGTPSFEEQTAARQRGLEEDAAWRLNARQPNLADVRAQNANALRDSIVKRVDNLGANVDALRDRVESGDTSTATLASLASAIREHRVAQADLANFESNNTPTATPEATPAATTPEVAATQGELFRNLPITTPREDAIATAQQSTALKAVEDTKKSVLRSAQRQWNKKFKEFNDSILEEFGHLPQDEATQQLAERQADWLQNNPQPTIDTAWQLHQERVLADRAKKAGTAPQAVPVAEATPVPAQRAVAPVEAPAASTAASKIGLGNRLRQQAEGAPSEPATLHDVEQELTKAIHSSDVKTLNTLMDNGQLFLVESAKDLPAGAKPMPNNTAGFYDGERAYVVADQLPKGGVVEGMKSVAAHEVGHGLDFAGGEAPRTYRDIVGDEANAKLRTTIESLAEKGNPDAKEAVRRAKEGSTPETYELELPRYAANVALENRAASGPLKRALINSLSGARVALKNIIGDRNVNIKDLAYINDQMLKSVASRDTSLRATKAVPELPMVLGEKSNFYKQFLDSARTSKNIVGQEQFVKSDDFVKVRPEAERNLANAANGKDIRVRDLLDGDELLNDYKGTVGDIAIEPSEQVGQGASYVRGYDYNGVKIPDTIRLGDRYFDSGYLSDPANALKLKQSLLHEIQHHVQREEGWAGGAGVSDFYDAATKEARNKWMEASKDIATTLDDLRQNGAVDPAITDVVRNAAERVDILPRNTLHRDNVAMDVAAKLDRSSNKLDHATADTLRQLVKEREDNGDIYEQGHREAVDQYGRVYGEQQARFTEAKAETPQEELPINPDRDQGGYTTTPDYLRPGKNIREPGEESILSYDNGPKRAFMTVDSEGRPTGRNLTVGESEPAQAAQGLAQRTNTPEGMTERELNEIMPRRPGESEESYSRRAAGDFIRQSVELKRLSKERQNFGRDAMRQMFGATARLADTMDAVFDIYSKHADRQGTLANREAIHQWETGQEVTDPKAREFFNTMKEAFDERLEILKQIRPDAFKDLITNYFPHLYKDTELAQRWYSSNMGKKIDGSKSFLQAREYTTMKDAMDAGLRPVTENYVEMAKLQLQQIDKFIFANEFKKELERNNMVLELESGQRVPTGFSTVDSKVFQKPGKLVVIPEGIAADLNNYMNPGLNRFQAWRAFRSLQNGVMSARLGWSAFHGGFTTIDSAVMHADVGAGRLMMGDFKGGLTTILKGLASPIMSPIEGGALNKVWRGQEAKLGGFLDKIGYGEKDIEYILDALESGGATRLQQRHDMDFNNALKSIGQQYRQLQAPGEIRTRIKEAQDAFKQRSALSNAQAYGAGVVSAAGKTLSAAGEVSSYLIHQKLVPAQKMNARVMLFKFELDRFVSDLNKQRKLEGEAPLKRGDYRDIMEAMSPEAVRRIAAKVNTVVDDRLGQMNYDNHFWNKMAKDLGMATFGAVGWQAGTLKTILGAAHDVRYLVTPEKLGVPLDKSGKITDAQFRRVSGRMSYLVALALTVGGAGAVYQYLMTGEPPKELKDYFFPKTGRRNPDDSWERLQPPSYWMDHYKLATHPVETVGHKIHPLWGMLSDIATNKDFFNVKIRDEDAPFGEQAWQLAQYVAKGFLPYSATNLSKFTKEGRYGRAVGSFVGLNDAPKQYQNSDFQQFVAEAAGQQMAKEPLTKEQSEKYKMRTQVSNKLRAGEELDEEEQAFYDGLSKKQKENLKLRVDNPVPEYRFENMSPTQKLKAYDLATPEEIERYDLVDHIAKIKRKTVQELPPRIRDKVEQRIKEIVASRGINNDQ